jgi:hypothetical protein
MPGRRMLNGVKFMVSKLIFSCNYCSKFLGGIFSFTAAGQRFVIVNDAEIAFEMLDKKGSNYADRCVQSWRW